MLARNTVLRNRYRIIRPLGRGGMGQVYEAIDDTVDSIVAIKETFANTDKLRHAFEREAKLLANLRHEVLPRVTHHFLHGDRQFLVMDFVDGLNLAQRLRLRGIPFEYDMVLEWAHNLLDALAYLHRQPEPIIHRDIKPANIKVTDEGKVFLLDFGLAKGAPGQETSSVHGFTEAYAPLEQLNNSGTSPQSDLYSLGATLYHLLTNEPPVPASKRDQGIEERGKDPLVRAHLANSAVPERLSAAISQAMALKRKDRFASAISMTEDLREAALLVKREREQKILETSTLPIEIVLPAVTERAADLGKLKLASGNVPLKTITAPPPNVPPPPMDPSPPSWPSKIESEMATDSDAEREEAKKEVELKQAAEAEAHRATEEVKKRAEEESLRQVAEARRLAEEAARIRAEEEKARAAEEALKRQEAEARKREDALHQEELRRRELEAAAQRAEETKKQTEERCRGEEAERQRVAAEEARLREAEERKQKEAVLGQRSAVPARIIRQPRTLSVRNRIAIAVVSLVLLIGIALASLVYSTNGRRNLNSGRQTNQLAIATPEDPSTPQPSAESSSTPSHKLTNQEKQQLEGVIKRGNKAQDAKNYAEAERQYRQALALDPNEARAHYGLGFVFYKQARYGDAIDQYRRVIEVKPGDPEAHYALGLAYLKNENKSAAMEQYGELKNLKSKYANELLKEINKN